MPVSTEDYGPAGATATAGVLDAPVSVEAGLASATANAYVGFGDGPFGETPFGSPAGAQGLSSGDYGQASSTATAPIADGLAIGNCGPAVSQAFAFRVQDIDLDELLDAATIDTDRTPVLSVQVDWSGDNSFAHPLADVTSVVEQLTINREVSGELGDEIGWIEGVSAASVTMILGGDWQPYLDGDLATDPVKAMAPYRTDAEIAANQAIIGRSIKVRTGMQTTQGPVLLPRLTGRINGYSPSSADRVVELEGLDPADRLRATINSSAYGIDGLLLNRYGNAKYPAVINSQWLIDRCLRANGFYASPPPGSPTAVFSATMHGSWQAEIASATDMNQSVFPGASTPVSPWVVGDHPFGMLSPNPAFGTITTNWILTGAMIITPGSGWAMSAWVRVPADATVNQALVTAGFSDPFAAFSGITLGLVNGAPAAQLQWPDGDGASMRPVGWVQPSEPTWMFVGCHWKITGTGVTFTIHVNGVNYTAASSKPLTGVVQGPVTGILGRTAVPFTNVSMWFTPDAPSDTGWLGETWTPTAKIEQGANIWGGIKEMVNRESYQVIKEVVAAEYGAFGFDEDGVPYFRSRGAIHQVPTAEVITADHSLTDLAVHVDVTTVRNSIDYEVSLLCAGEYEVVFEAEYADQFDVPASSIRTVNIPLPSETIAVGTNNPVIFTDDELWNDAVNSPNYKRSDLFFVKPLSGVLGGTVSIWVYRYDRWGARVRITNNNPVAIRFATPDDEPGFRLAGRKVSAVEPPTVGSITNPTSIAKYGVQSYDLGGPSEYRQATSSVEYIANALLPWTASPKPVLSEVEVPHNPRRKLYDRITLVDPFGLGSVTTVVHGITTTFSTGDGARDRLMLRPEGSPPNW